MKKENQKVQLNIRISKEFNKELKYEYEKAKIEYVFWKDKSFNDFIIKIIQYGNIRISNDQKKRLQELYSKWNYQVPEHYQMSLNHFMRLIIINGYKVMEESIKEDK